MSFDLDTLFFTTVFTSGAAGVLLLLTWLQHRGVVALALWGGGFLLGSAGLALITQRGVIPDVWSIVVGNAVLAAAYGVVWLGIRKFEGRSLNVPVALAGAMTWLVACQIDAIYDNPHVRAGVMGAIVVGYTLLDAWEFWRGRDTMLMSRWPIIAVLFAHAAVFLSRVPLAGTWPPLGEREPFNWYVVVALEAVLAAICMAYLLGGMARERIALKHQSDALVDPLTGVANRRAFFEQGERLLRRLRYARRPAAVLVLDLDRFKQVNDACGHRAGDQVLRAFCDVATASLRPGDLFGRIGGEEFACLLANASRPGALQVAERIRLRFELTSLDAIAPDLTATVSVGVAMAEGKDEDLAMLVASADQALYRAKANGRNRIEVMPPRLALVESAAAG